MAKKRKSATVTEAASRKERRREERLAKKKTKRAGHSQRNDDEKIVEESHKVKPKSDDILGITDGMQERRKAAKRTKYRRVAEGNDESEDNYAHLDYETAAAMRSDDAEISALEEKLGLKSGKKERQRLNKEYAKLEGYGDDFGDFLDGIDDMVGRCMSGDGEEDEKEDCHRDEDDVDGFFDGTRFILGKRRSTDGDESVVSSSSGEEEIVPMKDSPICERDDVSSEDSDEDSDHNKQGVEMKRSSVSKLNQGSDSSDEGEGEEINTEGCGNTNERSVEDNGSGMTSSSDSKGSEGEDEKDEKDSDVGDKFTYRPSLGEDIYGNKIDDGKKSNAEPKKYIPPHLRKKSSEGQGEDGSRDDPHRQESLRNIQRSLNNALNRLSDKTMESVSKSVSGLYRSHPTHDVNECFWNNVKSACAPPHLVMSGLIPVYMACAAGTHFLTGEDKVQLGGFVMEKCVTELWEELRESREGGRGDTDPAAGEDDDSSNVNKTASNLTLILCYLYNYGVVHCMLIYDVVRDLIKNFMEVDVELLLLILSHCGYQLRSDDPAALKDIVLLVQERAVAIMDGKEGDDGSAHVANSSRVQYMILAMTDLKNNKRRKKDVAIGEKTVQYRKAIGRLKSAASAAGKASDACLRVPLADILEVETKGRWWNVGASWVGKQFHQNDDGQNHDADDGSMGSSSHKRHGEENEDELLALASRQRMNTDARRSVFCVIMGSTDCDDAFEKLARGGMLKGKAERDVVRVLLDCCGQEKSYNPYYAHLACRVCEYQQKSKFTFQLAYWDAFKQFDLMKARRAANLAKLLAHLVGIGHCLNLNILKVIDVTPDDMPETALIFLTIFFTNLFESFTDSSQVVHLFQRAFARKGKGQDSARLDGDDDALSGDDCEALRANFSVFLLQYLKSSPKNAKKSTFRKNWKAAVKVCESNGLESLLDM